MRKQQHTVIHTGKILTATYLKDRVSRPRREPGHDWGSERIVLVRLGHRELWWWRSHKSWMDILRGYEHTEAQLVLAEHCNGSSVTYRRIHEGGRMSKRLFMEHAREIDAHFGQEVAPFIDQKLTLIELKYGSTT